MDLDTGRAKVAQSGYLCAPFGYDSRPHFTHPVITLPALQAVDVISNLQVCSLRRRQYSIRDFCILF